MVENKRLLEVSTCNEKETKSTKINLQDNIALLNNILSELRAEGKTPQDDTIAAHTSSIGEQVEASRSRLFSTTCSERNKAGQTKNNS